MLLQLTSNLQQVLSKGVGIPILVMTLLAMIILPMPPFVLDLFFTFNICLSLIVLLAGIYSKKPLDFAVFPTILLVSTLLRLALNIASTRVVLLNGHLGTDAAGKVVESFGAVVIGGNYAVGLVVFIILVIINFVVVTKGAGRISEVSARFTLDAMPGKQMAIDADLNAGLITQDDAKKRRNEVREEADFYGSMDGASKFVRGDAIAGILILIINIMGGLCIGVLQHDMQFNEAVHNYALLTIGDGLVAQIPSLFLSTTAALMVTRVSSEQDMGGQIVSQLLDNPRTLMITAVLMLAMGLIPGMPHIAFISLGLVIAGIGYLYKKGGLAPKPVKEQEKIAKESQQRVTQEAHKELGWEDVNVVDTIGLEIGYRLIPLVDNQQGGKLMERIKGVRKKLSKKLGFLIPAVHIRDNLDIKPNCYRIILMGVTLAEAEVYGDRLLAIDSGQVFGKLEGIETVEPAYGLKATWVHSNQRDHAQSLGYTVVDPETVIATHISKIMTENAAELIGHEEVQQLLDRVASYVPKLVEELIPGKFSVSGLLKILQNLLREQVPIADIRRILETVTEHVARCQDPGELTALVRVALSRLIIQNINGLGDEIPIITLDPDLEQILQNAMQMGGQAGGGFEPRLIENLSKSLAEIVQKQEMAEQPAILLVPPQIRALLAQFARHSVPSLHVLSYQEIPDKKQLRIVGSVGQ